MNIPCQVARPDNENERNAYIFAAMFSKHVKISTFQKILRVFQVPRHGICLSAPVLSVYPIYTNHVPTVLRHKYEMQFPGFGNEGGFEIYLKWVAALAKWFNQIFHQLFCFPWLSGKDCIGDFHKHCKNFPWNFDAVVWRHFSVVTRSMWNIFGIIYNNFYRMLCSSALAAIDWLFFFRKYSNGSHQ